ncbi:MAG: primosomal protein N' [Eubacteriales bacterium]|nr:primosomal protein N' [Eubacteriales bacterium]
MFADVIVDISHKEVDELFQYSIPPEMSERIVPGMRVFVPFGKRCVEGFVMRLSEKTDIEPERIKPIERALDRYPVINAEMLELARYMQSKYRCNTVDSLRLMLPAEMRTGKVQPKKTVLIRLNEDADPTGLNERQLEIVSFLAEYDGTAEKTRFCKEKNVSPARVRTLVQKGVLIEEAVEEYRRPYRILSGEGSSVVPTEEQKTAIERINAAADNGGAEFLLKGVTGSGKTEVYMSVISHAIERNKTAVMLVPEISLTPQMVQRFRRRFGDDVAVIHSGLSAGERFDEWRKLRTGQAHIALGARSAVFSPLENLGVLIVDEEHENTYRSETHPRYNAIEVAQWRARYNRAALVLGSATPSVTHYYEAQKGRYQLLELTKRANECGLPKVEVVDMRAELVAGNRSMFSGTLYRRLKECLDEGNQAILFLNRRGYSTFVMCRKCSYVVKCPNCDVAMNYHIGRDRLVCHYCGHESPTVSVCPECGSPYIKYFGAGTQKIEEEVRRFFPEARILRMDYDTTSTKDASARIFKDFSDGKAQILIGTQMVAKGLDFPNVTLVGVMAADSLLHMPDFAAAERTFQLVTQVAGRAGRDAKQGHVVVQTYSPDHYAVLAATHQNYEEFYAEELSRRQAGAFPPFTVFMRILFSSANESAAADACGSAFTTVEKLLEDHKESIILLTSMPSPIQRIKGKFRYEIVVKALKDGKTDEIADILYDVAQAHAAVENVNVSTEIEPLTLI